MAGRFGGRRAIAALIALSASTFAYVTTETLPIGLLPVIAGDLGVTTSAVGLLVTGYGLVVVVTSIPLTRLTRRVRRRSLLCWLLVAFVLATALSAFSPDYWTLMVARMIVALSQAVFWSVITPATAALFRPDVRGRALSILYAGVSVATLAGVPAGTWLGQQAGWRVAFLALSALGLAILVTLWVLLPHTPAGQSDADRGSAPDAGRYWSLVVTTALAVTGAFTAFTYISPFLTDVSRLPETSVGVVLLVRGLAGLAGVFIAGLFVDRYGWLVMVALTAFQAVGLAAQFLLGTSPIPAVVTIAASGFALATVSAALGARVLEVAPGDSDLAAAGTSTAFNVGITAGAYAGSLLVTGAGVRSTALVGSLVTVAAFAMLLAEPALSTRRRTTAAARDQAKRQPVSPGR